jgi:hypothetical protein
MDTRTKIIVITFVAIPGFALRRKILTKSGLLDLFSRIARNKGISI